MKRSLLLTVWSFLLIVCGQQLAVAQTTVSGTVTDASSGEPIPGAVVVVRNTSVGTTTDNSGQYSIEVASADLVLEFRFVGYRTASVTLSEGMTTVDMALTTSIHGLHEVVVVGSRRLPRLLKDSAVPVDVLGPADLVSAQSTDIDEVLRAQIPSYNVQRHGIDDEATLVRPTTLRGLPADNVLVLINGKRRHRSASIALLGSSLNTGAQGPDLNMIPSIAIKQVEVLRDGAAAQYGADAVAGVLNFQLRDASDGLLLRMQGGKYFYGDGEYAHVGANVGLPLSQNGFINLSVEWRDAAPTIRSGQRADAKLLTERGYKDVRNPSQVWGSPDVDEHIVGFVNAGVQLGANTDIYAFGGYGKRTSEGGFYFRAPGTSNARGSVFRFGSGDSAIRAVMDLNENDDIVCRELADLPGLDSRIEPVDAFIIKYEGSCYLFNKKFPGGFTPQFGADISDYSGTGGIRGSMSNGLKWDLSVTAGHSQVDYYIYNTIAASYGPKTNTSFKPRSYVQDEITAGLYMSYPVEVGAFHSPLNVAFGAEWRNETFESQAGDEQSYKPGPYAGQGFSVGSNGYQGLNPDLAGSWSRPNYAAYIDLEADVSERFVLGVAARHENFYESFGSTIIGKLAMLFRLNDRAALRGTYTTGFRAPTPGQSNLQIFQTGFSGDGNLQEIGQLPPTHPISMGLGGKELDEETSRSFSFGGIFELRDNLDLTVDYFDITLEDRIAISGNIEINDEISDIIDATKELRGIEDLFEIKFFANDFDTRTKGLDILMSWQGTWDNGDETNATIAYNRTTQELLDWSRPQRITTFLKQQLGTPVTLTLLTKRRQIEMEAVNPKDRLVVSVHHHYGELHGLVRVNYYGGWQACLFGNNTCGGDLLRTYDPGWLFGGEVGFELSEGAYRFAVGVHNILDTKPDALQDETDGQGNLHPSSTPWDYNGRAWYARIMADMF